MDKTSPPPRKNYDYGEHTKIDNDEKSIKLDVKMKQNSGGASYIYVEDALFEILPNDSNVSTVCDKIFDHLALFDELLRQTKLCFKCHKSHIQRNPPKLSNRVRGGGISFRRLISELN